MTITAPLFVGRLGRPLNYNLLFNLPPTMDARDSRSKAAQHLPAGREHFGEER
jgi:hypothetical protein